MTGGGGASHEITQLENSKDVTESATHLKRELETFAMEEIVYALQVGQTVQSIGNHSINLIYKCNQLFE